MLVDYHYHRNARAVNTEIRVFCWFCKDHTGAFGIEYTTSEFPSRRHYFVHCINCGVSGPYKDTIEGALDAFHAIKDLLKEPEVK